MQIPEAGLRRKHRARICEGRERTLAISVESGGVLCATGRAWMAHESRAARKPHDLPTSVPPAERPKASADTLAVGVALGNTP